MTRSFFEIYFEKIGKHCRKLQIGENTYKHTWQKVENHSKMYQEEAWTKICVDLGDGCRKRTIEFQT